MRLPALWLGLSFAAGICVSQGLGGGWQLWAIAAIASILIGLILYAFSAHSIAWAVALAAWVLVGGAAAKLERASVPANNVARLISGARIDSTEPLRWRGTLRDDPLELPWGRRYEVDLDSVEIKGQLTRVTGGLRANVFNPQRGDVLPRETLRAGDPVQLLLRARVPRNFLDPGAFDDRAYLAGQGIDLVGNLRSIALIQKTGTQASSLPFRYRVARWRGSLLSRINTLFVAQPDRAAILRAMLLGDRSFVDSDTVLMFQRTGAYHILVVAGLHVAAFAFFIFWAMRRLRLPVWARTLIGMFAIASYAGIVQDRAPIERAALTACFFLCARLFFRRVDLLNAIGVAALVLLLFRPSSLLDSSFQLSFLAAGVIAGVALPWIERTSSPRRAALAHLGDVTRDAVHPPKMIQLRIELRAAAHWVSARLPFRLGSRAASLLTAPFHLGLRLWDIALLSFVIQWGMLPLMARYFHRVTLSGPISNIPAVLITGAIVPLGFFALAATFVAKSVAVAAAHVLAVLVGCLTASLRLFDNLPRLSYRIPEPPIWLLCVFFSALVWLAIMSRSAVRLRHGRGRRRLPAAPIRAAEWAAATALAFFSVLIASHPFQPNLQRGSLEVTVLDIGQGDSIFAAFPDGRTMLIDGGGQAGAERIGGYRTGLDVGEDVVSPYLWSRGVKKLDVVALTHAHHDHLDGLHAVLANFKVGELWVGHDEETRAYEEFLAEARAHGIPIVHEQAGRHFDWDGVEGRFLWPTDTEPVKAASNDDSLVLRLTDRKIRFLLPGDIEKKVESHLLADGQPLTADFLKVPHHGSKTSSTDPFILAVQPQFAAISAGLDNPFGHPNAEVVDRYRAHGVQVLRTDMNGAITAITDGDSLRVSSFVSLPN